MGLWGLTVVSLLLSTSPMSIVSETTQSCPVIGVCVLIMGLKAYVGA